MPVGQLDLSSWYHRQKRFIPRDYLVRLKVGDVLTLEIAVPKDIPSYTNAEELHDGKKYVIKEKLDNGLDGSEKELKLIMEGVKHADKLVWKWANSLYDGRFYRTLGIGKTKRVTPMLGFVMDDPIIRKKVKALQEKEQRKMQEESNRRYNEWLEHQKEIEDRKTAKAERKAEKAHRKEERERSHLSGEARLDRLLRILDKKAEPKKEVVFLPPKSSKKKKKKGRRR